MDRRVDLYGERYECSVRNLPYRSWMSFVFLFFFLAGVEERERSVASMVLSFPLVDYDPFAEWSDFCGLFLLPPSTLMDSLDSVVDDLWCFRTHGKKLRHAFGGRV